MFWIWVAGLVVGSVLIGWALGLNAGAEADTAEIGRAHV